MDNLDIPMARNLGMGTKEPDRKQVAAPSLVSARLRVLLVEHDLLFRHRLRRFLDQECDVTAVSNSNEAWRKITNNAAAFDLILCDLKMPSCDGLRILKFVNNNHPELGFILMSDTSDVGLAVQSMHAGAFDFITKPVTALDTILTRIRKWQQQQTLDYKLTEYARLHKEVVSCMEVRSFLCIDVVSSFKLKENADPFLAQYTFHAYQQLIETVVTEHKGDIHSTAGDGMMICFTDTTNAVQAATAIIGRLASFNRLRNWLPDDFVVRQGIHTGPVVLGTGRRISTLFSKTLDVTGHIQKDAEPGRVEISEEALSGIACKQRFMPTARLVDGGRVYYLADKSCIKQ